MKTYNTKTIYVNGTSQYITTSTGFNPSIPEFWYNSFYSLRFILTDKDSNPIDLTGYSFIFGIDDSFQSAHTDLVRSNDDKFNISGDWSETDLSGGKITCRVDCSSASILTALEDDSYKIAYAELWATKVGSLIIFYVNLSVI